MRFLNWIMSGLFVVSAILQWNDPDPWRWVAIYVAAAACGLVHRTPGLWLTSGIGLTALIWGIQLASEVWGQATPVDLFRPMAAGHPEIEIGREAGGLFIVFGWMLVRSIWLVRNARK